MGFSGYTYINMLDIFAMNLLLASFRVNACVCPDLHLLSDNV